MSSKGVLASVYGSKASKASVLMLCKKLQVKSLLSEFVNCFLMHENYCYAITPYLVLSLTFSRYSHHVKLMC